MRRDNPEIDTKCHASEGWHPKIIIMILISGLLRPIGPRNDGIVKTNFLIDLAFEMRYIARLFKRI